MIDERTDLGTLVDNRSALANQMADALTRGNVVSESRHFMAAL